MQEQGLNASLYYENSDFRQEGKGWGASLGVPTDVCLLWLCCRRNVSVVPTSAFTGEGIPDLLFLIVQLTQQLM